MGKVRVRRFRSCRQDPLAGGSSKRTRGREETFRANSIQPSPLPSGAGPTEKPPAVISKLCSSCSAADKDYACRCVANCVFNRDYLEQLLKHGVADKLSALFLDDSVSVREVATGAFRNLTLAVEPSAESKVASGEVLAVLPVLIRECHCALDPKGSAPPEALELWMSVAEQALHTLWNLVELSTAVVEVVQHEQLVPLLVDFTQHHWTLATPSAQCLYSVLDDNPAQCGMLGGSGEHLQQLLSLLTQKKEVPQVEEPHAMVVRTAVCGALHGVLPYLPPAQSTELASVVCGVLGSVLDMDPLPTLSLAPPADQGPDQPPHSSHGKDTGGGREDTDQECVCADVRRRLAAQQLALEVLTNMTCSDDDEDEWEDMEEVVADGNDMLVEGELGNSPSELIQCMLQYCLHEKVWSKCRLTSHDALQVLQSRDSLRPLQQCVVAVQSTALMCLQNLLSFLPVQSWSSPLALQQMWEALLQTLLDKDGQADSADLLEATLGALRGTLVHLDIQCVTNSQLEFLCVFVCTPSLPPPVCTSAVRLLGQVAMSATPGTPAEVALQAVARAFSQVLSASPDVRVQAEVLDSVFDAFGGSDLSAAVVASSGLLASLCAFQPVFADKLKQQEGGQDQAVVEVARTNLPRFIQYIKRITLSEQSGRVV